MMMRCSVAGAVALLSPWFGREATALEARWRGPAPRVGRMCEFVVDAPTDVANPFDSNQAALDAEVLAPSGQRARVPGFYSIPQRMETAPAPKRIVRYMRVFLSAREFRKGHVAEMLMDDLRLVDRDAGQVVVLDDFETRQPWTEQRARLSLDSQHPHAGKRALRITWTFDRLQGWPGAGRGVAREDWTRFDEMRVWVKPLRGLDAAQPGIEFYTTDGAKIQRRIHVVAGARGEWRELVWELPARRERLEFVQAGKPEWLVRFTPSEAGEHRVALKFRGEAGKLEGRLVFDVAAAAAPRFVRVSPRDSRYFEFADGKPYFAIGSNLLGRDLPYYRRFLNRLAAAKCNYIRIWLSPRTMGFVTLKGEYAQDKAAQLDELFRLCRERGIYVMACLTDFREVCAFHKHGYWRESPYNAARGGPCAKPEDFFSNAKAKEMYRRELRYAVARWSAFTSIHSWEFFNEVNITDGWRKTPSKVRQWHREMAAYLRSIEPYGRITTSSFAGLEDDALWEQPNMDMVQRHFYLRPGDDFVNWAAAAQAALARHSKPALIGEFGRRKNEFADVDKEGVSLHNGLWASVMAGGCGTAMTWWWGWLDEHKLWFHFEHLAEFVRGIDWPAEGFAALAGDVACDPDPKIGYGVVRVTPTAGSFRPGPHNRPVRVTLTRKGAPDRPKLVARIVHGVRNHPKLHNPVTFAADYPVAGEFAAVVAGVSQYGGAGLAISVDGREALRKEFADSPNDKEMDTRYNGRYAVRVPAGRHEIKVENPGKDWFRLSAYEFMGGLAMPPLRLIGLRGKRTVVAWLWNETHRWDSPILHTPRVTWRNVSATLRGLAPGRWRARSFNPWIGEWGATREVSVAVDGRVTLRVDAVARDVAWRLECSR